MKISWAASAVQAALAAHASVVMTDDFPLPGAGDPATCSPAFHAAWSASGSRIEKIDGNGLLPARAADRAYPTAFAFRRFLQKTLPDWLASQVADHRGRVVVHLTCKDRSLNALEAAVGRSAAWRR